MRDVGRRVLCAGVMVLFAMLCGSGCDRTYLTPTHGRAYRQIFAAQAVNPPRPAEDKTVHGLDSQEAAIISRNYRSGLSPRNEGAASGGAQLLMYAPRTGARDGNLPPPSVPNDR
jgi:hypothetical protein